MAGCGGRAVSGMQPCHQEQETMHSPAAHWHLHTEDLDPLSINGTLCVLYQGKLQVPIMPPAHLYHRLVQLDAMKR